jgi:hypothetical protein
MKFGADITPFQIHTSQFLQSIFPVLWLDAEIAEAEG